MYTNTDRTTTDTELSNRRTARTRLILSWQPRGNQFARTDAKLLALQYVPNLLLFTDSQKQITTYLLLINMISEL